MAEKQTESGTVSVENTPTAYKNPAYDATFGVPPGGPPPVVFSQPQAMGFTDGGVPRGLEYLAQLDRLEVHQVLHLEEVLLGWERNNCYQICNAQNQQFLTAKEETDCCTRQMCGNMRPFDMYINDMQGQPIIHLNRGLHCQGCLCPCCLQEMDIMYPVGNKLATIKEKWSCQIPRYEIYDTNGTLMYTMEGICCWCGCCMEIPFKIFRSDGQEAGEIVKHWGGCREVFGQVNDFSIQYASNEHPINKAILLGATFLVDFMYFEHKQK